MRITGSLYVEVKITNAYGEELSVGKYWEKYSSNPNTRLSRSDSDSEKYRNERDIYELPELIEKEILNLFESNLLEYDPGSFEYDSEEGQIHINLEDFPLYAIKNIYDRKFNTVIKGRNVSIRFLEIADPEITPEPDGEFGYDDGKNDMFNFMDAVLSGNLEVIDRILASGEVDVNNRMPIDCLYNDERAIQIATIYGQIEVIRRLITAGADINIGRPTSLCIAAGKGHLDIFNILIEAGADRNIDCSMSPWTKKSILAYAAENGQDTIVHRCIELGLDVNQDEPLYLACTHISEARYANYFNTIRLLIEVGANVDTPRSPLVYEIIRNGYIDIIRLLVPHINTQSVLDNALYDAVLRGRELRNVAPYPEIVNMLLEKGANPDAPNYERGNGRSLLAFVNKAMQQQLLLLTTVMKSEEIARVAQRLGFTPAEITDLLAQRAASRRGPALLAWGKKQNEIHRVEAGNNNNQNGGRRTRRTRRRQRKWTRSRARK